jgi:ABC-2 type transport system permease protein
VRRKPSFFASVAAIAYREASIIRHDRAFIWAQLVQPVILLVMYGVLAQKPRNVPWAVLDESRTAVSRRLVAEVQTTGYFLEPEAVSGYDEGRALLEQGRALVLVVVPQSFARDVERGRPEVQVLLDGSDPLSAARVGAYVAEVAAAFDPLEREGPGHAAEARARAGPDLDLRQQFLFNPTLRDRDFFLAIFGGMLLLNICTSATSLGLVGEKESGTYEQVLALPTTSLEIVLGKLIPYAVIALVALLAATGLAGLVYGFWPVGSMFALLLATMPFVLASLAIGVLVSVLARTTAQAVFISVFFTLPSIVLSGAMLPYQLMAEPARTLGGLFPLRWYQIVLRRIVARGAGLEDVLLPALALAAIFAGLLAAIRWRMKPRLG